MIIINIKDGESIDRALKRYKRKHQRIGVTKELRRRKHFTKPSIERRSEVLKAVYKEQKYGNESGEATTTLG
ncbi:MAG: 30S ribosomal protein S21 [Saprospiraceae bacterium]|nr:30S ribosomal protein S21 [Saprospiraceae bacterium]